MCKTKKLYFANIKSFVYSAATRNGTGFQALIAQTLYSKGFEAILPRHPAYTFSSKIL
jgi:hypothetical protein